MAYKPIIERDAYKLENGMIRQSVLFQSEKDSFLQNYDTSVWNDDDFNKWLKLTLEKYDAGVVPTVPKGEVTVSEVPPDATDTDAQKRSEYLEKYVKLSTWLKMTEKGLTLPAEADISALQAEMSREISKNPDWFQTFRVLG